MELLAAPESWQYCDICGTKETKPFSAKRALDRHIREQHSGTTEHLCQDCDKPFKQARYLKRHQTTPGQCLGRNVPTIAVSTSSRKHPLEVDMEELSRKHCKTDGPDAPSIAILAPGKPEPGLENLDTATKACDGVTSKEILMEQGGLAPIRRAEDDTAGAYAHDNASHSISSDDQVQDLDQNLAVVSPDQETQRPLSNGDSSKIESDLEVLTASPASTHVSSQCADVLDWDLSEVNTLQVLTEACNKYYTEASDEDSKYASDEGSDEESERCRTSDSLRTNLQSLRA